MLWKDTKLPVNVMERGDSDTSLMIKSPVPQIFGKEVLLTGSLPQPFSGIETGPAIHPELESAIGSIQSLQ